MMMEAVNTDAGELCAKPAPCSILVVDDDELVAARLVSLLKVAGYQVESALSGADALSMASATPFQIVVTDWEMPDMDGTELCRALRRGDEQHYTYVMLLTVRRDTADVLAGLGAGADDYLVKGASSAELLARIEVGRRITQLERSLRASNAENRRLSLTDPLTGAHNRRSLIKNLPREIERCTRYGHPLAILSCDIDEFKRVNDTYGHEAGDEVLQAFVSRALACTRRSIDWVSRSGGEEFIVVLPETTLNGAAHVAEKIRHGLSARPVPTCAGPLQVTVSVGVTALESSSEIANISMVEMLRAADRCLYASKQQGRDRITTLPPERAGCLPLTQPA